MPPASLVRPFTLLDAIVLIAGVAAGFAVTRDLADLHHMRTEVYVSLNGPPGAYHIRNFPIESYGSAGVWTPTRRFPFARWGHITTFWSGPSLAALSLAVFVVTLRPPRPALKVLFRRPGAIAGAATIAAMVVAASQSMHLLYVSLAPLPPVFTPVTMWRYRWLIALYAMPSASAYAVTMSWLTLLLSGRWAAHPCWPDRMGRILGACWFGMALLGFVSSCLLQFR